MNIQEETHEYLFVQHVLKTMGNPENHRPDIEPGGLWLAGKLRLTWGMRMATEPPTLQVGKNSAALNGNSAFLPYELEGRLAVWRTALANRTTSNHAELANLDFREFVMLTAILAWTPEAITADADA